MIDTFPTSAFGFLSQDIDIERQVLSAGVSLSGQEDIVATDGGGRVFAEFSDGSLVDRDKVLLWRAMLGNLEGGIVPVIVPFCDRRHQPYGGEHKVTYGDGATHSDGTPFDGGGPFARSTSAAALRATQVEFAGAFAQPLIGGEWFTVVHPTRGPRAYRVRKVVGATLSFSPPLREAIDAETVLDFSEPRCIMVQDGETSSPLVSRRLTVAAIRFKESF